MNLFYNQHITTETQEIVFNKEESRHIGKVLRKQNGDILDITNGQGYFFQAELISVTPKECIGTILSAKKQPPLPYHLHLAVAPTKLNDRYEWFLEKATEIGVSEITPIICDHSERKVIKPERYEKIIQSAMKQSLKAYLPKLNPAIDLQSFLTNRTEINIQKFIAHCEETDRKSLKNMLLPSKNTLILIGPEGDFSSKEINLALINQFIPISLGESRLRTETAAIAACHSVSFIHQE